MSVRLEPWGPGDRALLGALVGDPVMMEHLGGAETPDKIDERHALYEATDDQFRIVDKATGEAAGWVGFWEREWRGEDVLEAGWSVLPGFQGRGIAVAATALAIDRARSAGRHRAMHAFPAVSNAASNAICRKLGFTLLGEVEFEYPPGHVMRCNDWRIDLSPDRGEGRG